MGTNSVITDGFGVYAEQQTAQEALVYIGEVFTNIYLLICLLIHPF